MTLGLRENKTLARTWWNIGLTLYVGEESIQNLTNANVIEILQKTTSGQQSNRNIGRLISYSTTPKNHASSIIILFYSAVLKRNIYKCMEMDDLHEL